MPPATIGFKAETLPGVRRRPRPRPTSQAAGLTAAQLKIDLYYPSDVVRPYMPDPKGIAQAIAQDLQAIGFTVSLKTEDWHGGYVSDATGGKFPLYLFGWTCDWAGADNFLYTAWFGYQDGKPNLQFGWKNDAGQHADAQGSRRADRRRGQRRLGPGPGSPRAGPPGRADRQLARRRASIPSKVHGFVGASNGIEYFNTVWLSK